MKQESEYYYERPFAYELYHQFRKLQEINKETSSPIFLSGETIKDHRKSPDLVLHKYQTKREWLEHKEGQYWICEIKMFKGNTTPFAKIEDDFMKFKTSFEIFNFKHCIFLFIDAEEDALLNILDYIPSSINSENYDKIICMSIKEEDKTKQLIVHTLGSLMGHKNKRVISGS